MSLSKRKEKWMMNTEHISRNMDIRVFLVEFSGNAICLICEEKLAALKECDLKQHYASKHGEHHDNYRGDDRKKRAEQLQRGLLSQQEPFHRAAEDADAAVEASCGQWIKQQGVKAIHRGSTCYKWLIFCVPNRKACLTTCSVCKHCGRAD